MGHEDVKELIDYLRDTDITEVLVEREGVKIRIRREKYFAQPETYQPVAVERKVVAKEESAPEQPSVAEPVKQLFMVPSPIVGTFYRAPSPETPPFVEVGSRVRKGQVLCILEAMKLMNEIESEVDGVISKILVENAHPVEYGETLFLIDTEV
jgi:acetyl-CoA carboxylase biotin carboxyl carrier protein